MTDPPTTVNDVAVPPAASPPRRWPKRLVIGLCVFVTLCILAVGSGYVYLRWRFNQVERIAVPPDVLKEDASGEPMNVLLIGTDSREGIAPGDAVGFCNRPDCSDQAGPSRTDTMMILHVDPETKKAAIVSIPRDLSVTVAETNRTDRINTAYQTGGVARLIKTIQTNLDVQVNHFAVVNFVGFQRIVDAVGGVRIPFPSPARDLNSHLDVTAADIAEQHGCVKLNGQQALAYARSRHYQSLDGGRWSSDDPRADKGRIARQQIFLQRMMKEAVSQGLHNPFKLNRLVGIGIKHVAIDSELSTKDIRALATRFRSLDPEKVDLVTLPTQPIGSVASGTYGGEQLIRALAQPLIDRLNGKGVQPGGFFGATAKPSDVRVRVLNGAGIAGLAGRVTTDLRAQGYSVIDSGNADNFNYLRSVVRHRPEFPAKGQIVSQSLVSGGRLLPDATLQGVDVALIVGQDYAGVRALPQAGASGSTVPTTNTTISPPPEPVPPSRGAPVPLPKCG
jgi:LCP family protein required for cell wall assembly